MRVICDSKSILIPRDGDCTIETYFYDVTVNFTIGIPVANVGAKTRYYPVNFIKIVTLLLQYSFIILIKVSILWLTRSPYRGLSFLWKVCSIKAFRGLEVVIQTGRSRGIGPSGCLDSVSFVWELL